MPGELFIVATPIGNLEDITQRALRMLREVDLIACEDTRHTRKLLNHFSIDRKMVSYHEHNERERAEELCELLESGQNVALVSDAGTPLINDPGYRIVTAAIERGIRVIPVPGPVALVAALAASGLPSDEFFFGGFLPARAHPRRAKLEELRSVRATLGFYEAPHRIVAALKDAAEVLGNRRAVVARELTKLHEEFVRGTLNELVEQFSKVGAARGEMVLIISGEAVESRPANAEQTNTERLVERVEELEREGLNSKDALKSAARELGIKRAEAYRIMTAQKNRRTK
ncbi:MAG TPA: 16S rRNA (cytidine(1402)-2'-O)-methyltransferase [Pyrinomonadaceae bacterium]|nr:16S rRNA (cytidine(1402)-2'-O)-methyltransferase [Pyrinomonadaceae bacterium]